MTLRRLFLLLIAPLFLLLAGVNGVLLYAWDQAEARRQLQNEAVAAALSAAAFTDVVDDLGRTLADPRRAAMLTAAAEQIQGIRALYVVRPDGFRWIAGTARANQRRYDRPEAAVALPLADDAEGRFVATALAPATNGRLVVAQIDAEPLLARTASLRRLLVSLVAGAGVLGFVLAWLTARIIARDVVRTHRLVVADGADPGADEAAYAVRETGDLAAAVRLMRASVAGRNERSRHELARRDRARSEATAVAAWRETAVPPLSTSVAGVAVAVRRFGAAPAGSFHALCVSGERAAIVIGECEGATPSEALARALAAQRFCEASVLDGDPRAQLDLAMRAFAISKVAWTEWTSAAPAPVGILSLLGRDADEKAEAYRRRAANLTPDEILDDLERLLDADGVVAVLRPAGPERQA